MTNATVLKGGTSTLGMVTLNGIAPSNGYVVPLSSNLAEIAVPSSTTSPAGSKWASFTVTTSPATVMKSGTITAGSGAGAKVIGVTVTP